MRTSPLTERARISTSGPSPFDAAPESSSSEETSPETAFASTKTREPATDARLEVARDGHERDLALGDGHVLVAGDGLRRHGPLRVVDPDVARDRLGLELPPDRADLGVAGDRLQAEPSRDGADADVAARGDERGVAVDGVPPDVAGDGPAPVARPEPTPRLDVGRARAHRDLRPLAGSGRAAAPGACGRSGSRSRAPRAPRRRARGPRRAGAARLLLRSITRGSRRCRRAARGRPPSWWSPRPRARSPRRERRGRARAGPVSRRWS